MPHYSTKTYASDRGLACAYRQWNAGTHCSLLHGYALGFRFVFAAERLDHRGWVLDFGEAGFGEIRRWLHAAFDHKTLVAADDPDRRAFEYLAAASVAEVRIVPGTSCEVLAEWVHEQVQDIVNRATQGRCWVRSVECFEHGANSAIFEPPDAGRRELVSEVLRDVIRLTT